MTKHTEINTKHFVFQCEHIEGIIHLVAWKKVAGDLDFYVHLERRSIHEINQLIMQDVNYT